MEYRRWNAVHHDDSDPFDGESSVSLDSSFESDEEERDREIF